MSFSFITERLPGRPQRPVPVRLCRRRYFYHPQLEPVGTLSGWIIAPCPFSQHCPEVTTHCECICSAGVARSSPRQRQMAGKCRCCSRRPTIRLPCCSSSALSCCLFLTGWTPLLYAQGVTLSRPLPFLQMYRLRSSEPHREVVGSGAKECTGHPGETLIDTEFP